MLARGVGAMQREGKERRTESVPVLGSWLERRERHKPKEMQLEMPFPANGREQKHKYWKQFPVPLGGMFCHVFVSVFPSPFILRCRSSERVSLGLPQADTRKQQAGSPGWQAGHLVSCVLGPLALPGN